MTVDVRADLAHERGMSRSLPRLLLLVLACAAGCAHKTAASKTSEHGENAGASSSGATPAAASGASGTGAANACETIRVHFDLDSAEIRATDRPLLEQSATCLRGDRALHVVIEGNADERGTEEYNVALGDRRAQSVARYLEKLGASPPQLKTVSYGKNNPECTEHDEACWAKNRRSAVKPSN